MPKYEVLVPEIHYQAVVIEAESELAALMEVREGEGDIVKGKLEYSCVMEEYLDIALAELEAGETHHDWMIQEVTDAQV